MVFLMKQLAVKGAPHVSFLWVGIAMVRVIFNFFINIGGQDHVRAVLSAR